MIGPEAEQVFVLAINWDTLSDGNEFFHTFQSFAQAENGDTAIKRSDGDARKWWISREQTVFLENGADSSLLIIADEESLIQKVLPVLNISSQISEIG